MTINKNATVVFLERQGELYTMSFTSAAPSAISQDHTLHSCLSIPKIGLDLPNFP